MKIVQVLDYYASGNAVANCAVTYHKFSEKLGFESKIVARLIDKRDTYVAELTYLDELSPEDVIMYHLCIGTTLNNDICDYECKKVLVYHNITPPEFLEKYNQGLAGACEEGLRQLVMMKPYFQLCLADSEFNRQDLIRAGYDGDKITVIPPFVSRKDFENAPDFDIVKKYRDGWTNILFVGRVSPHKKYEDLIRIFDYYKKNVNPKSRLILAGGVMENYYECLSAYVKELGLSDVLFTKQISFSALLAFYRTASVFLCASEHEGYCIPLIEAMVFNIPVIGFDAGAVKETMGGAGILVQDKSPVLVSKIIDELERSEELRGHVLERQNNYLETLTEDKLFERYRDWVQNLDCIEDISVRQDQMVKIEEGCAPYDVVMVIKAADWNTARINLSYIRKNLKPKRIVIISSGQLREYLKPEDQVVFINEDKLYTGLSFQSVRAFFEERKLPLSLTGWFLQQFLKFAYAFVCEDEYYLTWDADTIPLNPVSMMDEATGKPCFDMKPEYVEPYFDTLYNLLGLKKIEEESFIAEHMLFSVQVVKDMIFRIEQNDGIFGETFFEKILNASDFCRQGNVFSEFETYGTFCRYYYPDLYVKRHIDSFRGGKMFLGEEPSQAVLSWVSKDKDIVSFEYPQPVIQKARALSEHKKFRDKYTFREFVERVYLSDVSNQSKWLQEEEATLLMDYPWAKEPIYRQSDRWKALRKERTGNKNKKLLVYKPYSRLCALSFILGKKGYDVTAVDPAGRIPDMITKNIPTGIKALQDSGSLEGLKVVKELTKEEEFLCAFIPKDYVDEYVSLLSRPGLKVENCVIAGNGFTKRDCDAAKDVENRRMLMDTSLIGGRALLGNGRTGLYVHAEDRAFVNRLQEEFSESLRIESMEDIDEFVAFSEKAGQFMEGVLKLKMQIFGEEEGRFGYFLEKIRI